MIHKMLFIFLSLIFLSFSAICKLATVDENTGYHYHPSDCSKFLQCYPGVRDYRIETRKCPFGMFWDEDTVTCRPPKDVMCAGGKQ